MSMTETTADAPSATEKVEPALKLNFLSHGTLESRDLEFTRKFYEEFLGFEVHRTSPISLIVRLGGPHGALKRAIEVLEIALLRGTRPVSAGKL